MICSISDNIDNLGEDELKMRDEYYGTDSRCFMGDYALISSPYVPYHRASCHKFSVY